MTVTASRLGSSPITLDWSNLAAVPAGSGTSARTYGADAQLFGESWQKLKARFSSGDAGFYDSVTRNDLSQAEECEALAKSLLKKEQFTDCLFLGIGGSALGPISLLNALEERRTTGVRFHFQENPDPLDWQATLRKLNPDQTLVCVVTKSGGTFETMSQFLLAMQWIGQSRVKTHVVAITDPSKGDLRAFATQYGIPTLQIAPSIGGRFSVFTPVGLFAAALSGLSLEKFQLGARQVRDYIERAPMEKNALFILGNDLIRHAPKRPVHVCMPYSTRLRSFGLWFVQLWGESLGKSGKGFTPVAAVGATDQHSILQLLRDGPDDKVTLFLAVDRLEGGEVRIPSTPIPADSAKFSSFKLLQGHTLHELLTVEFLATARVLTRQGRPNVTFRLDALDERSLGALYFAFSSLTAFTGSLWGIDPFDQPGVEEGKVYTREALLRSASGAREGGPDDPPGLGLGLDASEEDENSPVNRLRRGRDPE